MALSQLARLPEHQKQSINELLRLFRQQGLSEWPSGVSIEHPSSMKIALSMSATLPKYWEHWYNDGPSWLRSLAWHWWPSGVSLTAALYAAIALSKSVLLWDSLCSPWNRWPTCCRCQGFSATSLESCIAMLYLIWKCMCPAWMWFIALLDKLWSDPRTQDYSVTHPFQWALNIHWWQKASSSTASWKKPAGVFLGISSGMTEQKETSPSVGLLFSLMSS